MRIAVCPADLSGCGTYRLTWPAQAVQKVRPDWQIELYQPGAVQIGMRDGRATAVKGIDPHDLDMLVLQRVGSTGSLAFLKWAQDNGIATLVDSDDAMWCIDKSNIAHRIWNSQALHWRYLDQAAYHADLTTVTTEYLSKRYGKHGRCEILPNYVPEMVLNIQSERHEHDKKVSVGWSGFVGTHPNDLQTVGDALSGLDATVRVVGDGVGVAEAFGVGEERIDALGPKSLGVEYYSALSSIDVAVVPLEDSMFNRGKSSLKALEFSAMGVPVVASPTPANRLLAQTVPIVLAHSPEQWRTELERLLNNETERLERGRAAREAVRVGWTLESHAEQWAGAWERALGRRRALAS